MPIHHATIVHNQTTDPTFETLETIQNCLTEHQISSDVISVTKREMPAFSAQHYEKTNLLLVIGGDGTVLRTIRCFYTSTQAIQHNPNQITPVLAINRGSLGFLAKLNLENLAQEFNQIIKNPIQLEYRSLLSITPPENQEIQENTPLLALNDVVIRNRHPHHMLSLMVNVNGTPIARFDADGVIVSTPTGSTAYNLSAGGPIIAPNVDALAITPICPHSFSAKPIVISGNNRLTIEAMQPQTELIIAIDGQDYPLTRLSDSTVSDPGLTAIHIQKAPVQIPFVQCDSNDQEFYKLLHQKLHWAQPVRKTLAY